MAFKSENPNGSRWEEFDRFEEKISPCKGGEPPDYDTLLDFCHEIIKKASRKEITRAIEVTLETWTKFNTFG